MTMTAQQYPIRLEVEYPEHMSRLLIFVKWLFVIPHMLALTVLALVSYVAIVISWFVVVITGRYPRGLFDFTTGVLRWSTRATAYYLLLTDRYPPFSLADDPAYPIRVAFDYPERVARWHPLVNWLLAIPLFIALYGLMIVAYVAVFAGFFAILILGRMPHGLFGPIQVLLAWQLRVVGYAYWLTGRYPPLVWG